SPPWRKVAAAASSAIAAGGPESRAGVAFWRAWSRSQKAPPMAMVAVSWASRMQRKNFQNSRPMLVLDQLVALAVDGLQAGTAVGQGPQLVAQAAQVDVDIAVEARQRPPQALLGQVVLA